MREGEMVEGRGWWWYERESVCEIEFAAAAKARMARLDDLVWMDGFKK